jgi:ribosomal protein L22
MSAEDDVDRETETGQPADASPDTPAEAAATSASEDTPAATAAVPEDTAAEETAAEETAAEETAAEGKPARKKAAKAPRAKKAASKASDDEKAAEAKRKLVPRLGKAKTPAPTRRVVRAHARYVRTSARKARMVCGHLRGKSVQEARAILAFTPRDVARDWSKLLESAVANAESNHELLEDDLIIREAYADEGPTIKRFRPRAMGRATPIRKRTSHLTITLTPSSPQKNRQG